MTDAPETIPGDGSGDDRALLGEYVLGLLDPAEARGVETRLSREPALRDLHARWADDLTTVVAGPDVAPPARLRASVEARLFPEPAKRSGWAGWLALIAGPVAAFALAFLLLQPAAFEPVLHAELEATEGSTVTLAAGTDGTDLLILRRTGLPPAGRVLELWLIVGEAAPVSLGVLPDADRVVIPAPEGIGAGVVLAVSEEPVGGSTTGAPTGAVLAAGPLLDI